MLKVLIALLAPIALFPAPVLAGPLAQTARGIDNKSQGDRDRSSHSETSRESSDSSWVDDEEGRYAASQSSACFRCRARRAAQILRSLRLPPSAEARFAAQSVVDSDGAMHLRLAGLLGRGGLQFAFDHYYEHISAKGVPPEDVVMNLFEVTGLARVIRAPSLRADLRAGFAGATSTHFESLAGGMVGGSIAADLHDYFTLRLEGRAMLFEHGIKAFDAAAGVRAAKFVWLGYRALKFDVGPVLEGPEIGVGLAF